MVLVTRIRAPIAHQDWHGYEGRLHRVVDHKEGCYYCGLRPVNRHKALAGFVAQDADESAASAEPS